VLASADDTDSIGTTGNEDARNYVGYPKLFAWADPRFSNLPFAQNSMNFLANMMRQPEFSITLSCWPQWDLFPLMGIAVIDSRTGNLLYQPDGVTPLTLIITGIQNYLSVAANRLVQRSTISARMILPPDPSFQPPS
jgi:hypothetical protein